MSHAKGHDANRDSILISIVVPDPVLRSFQTFLISPLRNQIEVVVGAVHHVDSPRVARVGVKNRAALVFVEHADSLMKISSHRFPIGAMQVLLSHKSQWMPGIRGLSRYWLGRYLPCLRDSSYHPERWRTRLAYGRCNDLSRTLAPPFLRLPT